MRGESFAVCIWQILMAHLSEKLQKLRAEFGRVSERRKLRVYVKCE